MPGSPLPATLETVQLVRDIVLIAVLLISFVAIFVFSILGVHIYRQLSSVLRRAEGTLESVETLAGELSEGILKPLGRLRKGASRLRSLLSFLSGRQAERR
ncbi:MAG: hypothetical protein FJ313_01470 [Gemmatimonadetes bacterium]|nr:hypothetical protein [Gemmatimonadota bacterium]